MFENKKILILGMARSGVAAARVLLKKGNEVIINDLKDNHDKKIVNELKELGCNVILGMHPDNLLDNSFDYLVKNPGIRDDHKYVKLARKLNIPVINEVELAYSLLPRDITLIGITGTNGKTTTTTLTYQILKEEFKDKVHLTGNIGYPLCDLNPYCGYILSSSYIISSLVTFAITLAAAIDMLFASPFIIDVDGISNSSGIASISTCSSFSFSFTFFIASSIANLVAS